MVFPSCISLIILYYVCVSFFLLHSCWSFFATPNGPHLIAMGSVDASVTGCRFEGLETLKRWSRLSHVTTFHQAISVIFVHKPFLFLYPINHIYRYNSPTYFIALPFGRWNEKWRSTGWCGTPTSSGCSIVSLGERFYPGWAGFVGNFLRKIHRRFWRSMSVGGMIYLWITVLWSRLVVFRCFHVCSGFLEVLINHMLWDDGEVGRCCQGLEYTSISSSKLEWPIYKFSIKKMDIPVW